MQGLVWQTQDGCGGRNALAGTNKSESFQLEFQRVPRPVCLSHNTSHEQDYASRYGIHFSGARSKEWFWISESGKINLSVRYGSKTLELAKGKNAIELATGEELIAVLERLKAAVLAGELDAQIEAASGALRAGFVK